MAFEPDALSEVFQTIGGRFRAFYFETDDTRSEVLAPGYFTNVTERGVRPGNLFEVYSAGTHFTLNVKSVSEADVAIVEIERQESDYPFIEEVGSPDADGNWTAVFQAAALENQVFRLRDRTTYIASERSEVAANGFGLIGTRSSKIWLPASDWNNTDVTAFSGANQALFYVHASLLDAGDPLLGFTLRGMKIESEVQESRLQLIVAGRNIKDVDIQDVEICGLATGYAIRLSTVSGIISRTYIHDFAQSSATGFTGGSGIPQSTAITIDAERVDRLTGGAPESNVNSRNLTIAHNRIERLQFTGAALAAWNDQTDGINIGGAGKTSGIVLDGNNISYVGEGIDCFASDVTMTGNRIERATEYGIKLIHGASRNVVSGGSVRKCGRNGIIISGSVNGDCEDNLITGVYVADIDPDNRLPGQTLACIRFDNSGGGDAKDNVAESCILDPGTFGRWPVVKTTLVGSLNYVRQCRMTAGVSGYTNASNDPTPIGDLSPTRLIARMTSAQEVPSGTPTIIQFNNEGADGKAEFDSVTTFAFSPKLPNSYEVIAQIVSDEIDGEYSLILYRGEDSLTGTHGVAVLGDITTIKIHDILPLQVGDLVTVRLLHATGSDITVPGQADRCFLRINATIN